jgi:hypothetical protein
MRWILLLAALGGSAQWATAQSAPLVAPGSRVRVSLLTGLHERTRIFDGTVESVTGDTLMMRSLSGGNPQRYTPAADVQLFVLTGHQSSVMRGGAIGGLLGMVAGGIWGFTRQQECLNDSHNLCTNRKPIALKEGVVIGISGAVAGLVFGALDRREIWARAWMPDVAATTSPDGRRGLSLGLTFAF